MLCQFEQVLYLLCWKLGRTVTKIKFQNLCGWYKNVFASIKDLKSLKHLMTSKIPKLKICCDVNKLSINWDKTNSSQSNPQKKNIPKNLNIRNGDSSSYSLEWKQCIKYLGLIINESLRWKHQISFVCWRVSQNNGIILKIRQYLSIKELRQIQCILYSNLFLYFLWHISLRKCIQNTYKKKYFCQNIWK